MWHTVRAFVVGPVWPVRLSRSRPGECCGWYRTHRVWTAYTGRVRLDPRVARRTSCRSRKRPRRKGGMLSLDQIDR
jgi:hypothetical protein